MDQLEFVQENKVKSKKQKPVIGRRVKLGLALGGGGGLGIAHIGVIKALEELGIVPSFVAGTSAGSVIGAMYASGLNSAQMTEIAKTVKVKDIRNSSFLLKPSSAENIEEILNDVFKKELVFSELKVPFTAVSCDMRTGKEMDINYGSVAKAVAGSCAVPGVFKPVVYNDMHLVDGGLKNNLPTDVVRKMGANVVIAVELNYSRGFGTDSLSLLKILGNAIGIMMSATVESKLALADIVLQPDLKNFSKMNLDDIDGRIAMGYNSVMAAKAEIFSLIKKPKRKKHGSKNSYK